MGRNVTICGRKIRMMATSISTAIKGSISLDTLTKGRWERLQETNRQGPKGGVAIPMHMTKQ